MTFVDFLSRYANLILASITAVYAYLTWRMLLEMRRAREIQSDAMITIAPVPEAPVYAELELQNAGPGPAFDVELSFRLEPALDTPTRTWRQPLVAAREVHRFLLPEPPNSSTVTDIRAIASRHRLLVATVSWKNAFGRGRTVHADFDLASLPEGWYNAGHLIPPGDLPRQMKAIATLLDKIEHRLEAIARSK